MISLPDTNVSDNHRGDTGNSSHLNEGISVAQRRCPATGEADGPFWLIDWRIKSKTSEWYFLRQHLINATQKNATKSFNAWMVSVFRKKYVLAVLIKERWTLPETRFKLASDKIN